MQNIYVGNLNFTATEEQLRTLFADHGAVETVTIVRDRASGASRGLAMMPPRTGILTAQYETGKGDLVLVQ